MGNAFPHLGGAVVHLSEFSKRKAGKFRGLAQTLYVSGLMARWPTHVGAGGDRIRVSVFGNFANKCFVHVNGRRYVDTYWFGGRSFAREIARIREGIGADSQTNCLELGQDDYLDSYRFCVRFGSAL